MTSLTSPYNPKHGVDHLMRATGLSRETVRAAIRTGALPGTYVPSPSGGDRGMYVVPEDAFRAFCEGRWVASIRPIFTVPIRPIVTMRKTG